MSDFNFHDIIERLHEGVYFTDLQRRITYWNRAAETITGYRSEDVIGSRCSDDILLHVNHKGCNLCNDMCPLAATLADGTSRDARVFLHHRDGHRVPVSIRTVPLRDRQGCIVGAAEVFASVSRQEENEARIAELRQLALIDRLTEVANRHYAEMEIGRRLDEARRYGIAFALLVIDVDHLKPINDTHGHAIGDRVLRSVAATLSQNARSLDMVARWGGDEFVAVLRNVDGQALDAVADRLRMLISHSSVTAGTAKVHVTVSIGACMARCDDDISSLYERADRLLYRSKNSGRNRVSVEDQA